MCLLKTIVDWPTHLNIIGIIGTLNLKHYKRILCAIYEICIKFKYYALKASHEGQTMLIGIANVS